MTADSNRRGSVRITDRVLLAVHKVDPARYQAIAEEFANGISIYNQEGLGEIQMFIGAQTALNRLQDRDLDLAEFLKHMDNKVNLLLQRVQGERSLFDDLAPHKVSLSSSGLAFTSQEKYSQGDILEIHLVLLPDYTYIYAFARVVSCEPKGTVEGKPIYRVGVEYTLIMEEDQEKLVQHNFRQQTLALRARRLSREE